MDISDVLKELRLSNGHLQDELAEKTGLSQSAISEWERGVSRPNIEAVITLAKFYDVTTDYLLGIDANHTPYSPNLNPANNKNRHKFMQRLIELDLESLSDNELNIIIGITANAVKEFKKLKD